MTEESMTELEARIPAMAAGAFKHAMDQAMQSSGKVMRAVDGKLIESYADGTEKLVRVIHSLVKVTAGAKFKLKIRSRVTVSG